MTTLTEGNYIGDVVKYEEEQNYSREEVTILKNTSDLEIGSVLGQISASSKYQQIDFDAEDGSQIAAAICIEKVIVPSDADVEQVLVVKRHAIVVQGKLIFPTDATNEQIATAEAELNAIGIKIQEGA